MKEKKERFILSMTDLRLQTVKPHIGHVLTRVIKDMIPRYRTMKGYKVLRKSRLGYSRTSG